MNAPLNPGVAAGAAVERTLQATDTVLMVRPARFGWNAQTQSSNRFQRDEATLAPLAAQRALEEFDGVAAALREAGLRVHVAADDAPPARPDAVFPNNWASLHAEGTVVLYPMLAPSRRLERRLDVLGPLVDDGHRVTRLVDLTHHELHGAFLEGTGSVVFDHVARVAYAALSPRTHLAPLEELCAEIGYRPCPFRAIDPAGVPIYHTNVMLSIGTGHAVVAAHTIDAASRDRVLHSLLDTGREVVDLDASAVAGFGANVLELRAADGSRVLALSRAAHDALGPRRLEALLRNVDRLAVAAIPTIETLGGGSVRCMLAEVFLPRSPRALAGEVALRG